MRCLTITQRRLFRVRNMCVTRFCLAVGVVLRARCAGRRVALFVAERRVPVSCFLAGFAFFLPGPTLPSLLPAGAFDAFHFGLPLFFSRTQFRIVLPRLDGCLLGEVSWIAPALR